jgi:hypothetical protein
MSAPNAYSPSNVAIRSGAVSLNTTATTLLLGNADSSGHAYRVVALRACNNSITATTVTLSYLSASSTGIGTSYHLAQGTILNGFSYLDLLDAQHPCHLEENTSLAISNNNTSIVVDVFYSYEDIS